MFKKTLLSATLITSMLTMSVSAIDIDLDELPDDMWSETTSIETTSIENVSISNMDVVFNENKLPADSKSETTLIIGVYDNNDESLSDTQIDLDVVLTQNDDNTKGEIKNVEFDSESELFNVTYVAGSEDWTVNFKITATSKSDSSIVLEQGEELTLEKFEPIIETTTNEEDNNIDSILENLDNTETVTEEDNTEEILNVENEETSTEEVSTEGINIMETTVIDEKRLKITFDRKIFLPDNPLSLVDIKRTSDDTSVKISNVTLSEDEMSLIVLTLDEMTEEPYLVTLSSVVDGETMKKVSVVNWTLTVTWLFDHIYLVIAMIIGAWIFYRRKISK